MFRLYSYCLLACSAVHDLPTERPAAKTGPTLRSVLQTTPAPGLSLHRRIQPYRTPSRRCSHTAVSAVSDTDPAVSAAPPFQPRTADPHPAVSVATAGFSRRAVNRW